MKNSTLMIAAVILAGLSMSATAQTNTFQKQRDGFSQNRNFGRGQTRRRSAQTRNTRGTSPQQSAAARTNGGGAKKTNVRDGLVFRNHTKKSIVMYIYNANDSFRTFTVKDIRIEPNGKATWPAADNGRSQVWVKAMEVGSVFLVAPEKKVNTKGVIHIYQDKLRVTK